MRAALPAALKLNTMIIKPVAHGYLQSKLVRDNSLKLSPNLCVSSIITVLLNAHLVNECSLPVGNRHRMKMLPKDRILQNGSVEVYPRRRLLYAVRP